MNIKLGELKIDGNMKNIILKIILFIVTLIIMFYSALFVFRTEFPILTIPLLLVYLIILLYFPYNLIYKNNNNEKS